MAIHPGVILEEDFVKPSGATNAQIAKALGIPRSRLWELMNGRRGITPQMALRLERVFEKPALDWLIAQALWDLAQLSSVGGQPLRGLDGERT